MNRLIITFIMLIFFFYSCKNDRVPLKRVFSNAGKNKVELQKFLNNYKNDSLKLNAAKFLLISIEDCYSYDIQVNDAGNNPVSFNLYHPGVNRKNLIKILDSLNYYVTDTIAEDVKTIFSEYLIKNHEQAFEMWQTKPWSKNYSFEIFREFILPYRIDTESLNDWRIFFHDKYLPKLDSLKDSKNVKTVFDFVRKDIKTIYRYSSNAISLKPTQSYDEAIEYGKGNCVDIANIYLYALRAIGVAATKDYIPLWGRRDFGHCVLVFWNENNQPEKLMLENFNELFSPPPKVYRQFYSNQKNNLVDKIKSLEDIPPHLQQKNYSDVTNEYVKTSMVAIKPNIETQNRILYLSVYNVGRWQPITWSDSIITKSGEYVFKDMGRNIVYLPSMYSQKRNIPNGNPFVIGNDGRIEILALNTDSLVSMVFPKEGITKELYYWDNKWENVENAEVLDDSLRFEDVPSNTLYRLVNPNGNQTERIFTYKNNKRKKW